MGAASACEGGDCRRMTAEDPALDRLTAAPLPCLTAHFLPCCLEINHLHSDPFPEFASAEGLVTGCMGHRGAS